MAEKKKNPGRGQMVESKARSAEKDRPARSARTERKDQPRQESKSVRRETKGTPSWIMRIRNNRIGRFFYEAYYELRYKVTWPTFEQARNMTIAVLIISAIVGAILAAADFGLYHLFLLIVGRR
jgi:preprotein translocase SecE subunit